MVFTSRFNSWKWSVFFSCSGFDCRASHKARQAYGNYSPDLSVIFVTGSCLSSTAQADLGLITLLQPWEELELEAWAMMPGFTPRFSLRGHSQSVGAAESGRCRRSVPTLKWQITRDSSSFSPRQRHLLTCSHWTHPESSRCYHLLLFYSQTTTRAHARGTFNSLDLPTEKARTK